MKLTNKSATMSFDSWNILNDLPANVRASGLALSQETLVELIDLGL